VNNTKPHDLLAVWFLIPLFEMIEYYLDVYLSVAPQHIANHEEYLGRIELKRAGYSDNKKTKTNH